LYVSRWASADSAAKFAVIYAKSLATRYARANPVTEDGAAQTDLSKTDKLAGKHTWLTEQGPVLIQVRGDTVFVTESLDQATTDELQHELFARQ
jgi:hypothetical protein